MSSETSKKTSPRVLSLYDKHRDSGQVSRLKDLLLAYASRGSQVHYIASEPLFEEEHENVRAHIIWTPFRAKKGILYWTWLSFMIPAHFYLKAFSFFPRRVVFFETYYSYLCWLPSVLIGSKKILLMRAIIFPELEGKPLRRFYSRLVDYTAVLASDLIVAPTESMRSKLLTRLPSLNHRVRVVPFSANPQIADNALETSDELEEVPASEEWLAKQSQRKKQICLDFNIPDKNLLVAISGKRANQQNIEYFLRAMADASSNRLSLIVFGEYKEQQAIMSIVHGLGLEDRVVFTGSNQDIGRVLGACDLFVHCSGKEGMSTDLMSALGLGSGVLAIETPEMKEILRHSECLLPKANVGALSSQLLKLIKEKKYLSQVKERSRELAISYNFDWSKTVYGIIEGQE